MHHMKRSARVSSSSSSSSTPSVSRFDFSDAKSELRTRLRFQNKKPLCLQYNYSASQRTKKVMERMKRRNCDSFVKTFLPYLVTLFCTLVDLHCRVVDFLVKPVDDFEGATVAPFSSSSTSPPLSPMSTNTSFDFPASISPPSSPKLVRQGSTSSSSSRHKKTTQKRDFGRNARLAAQQNRMTELYVMP